MSKSFSENYPKRMHSLLLELCDGGFNCGNISELLKQLDPVVCHGTIGPGVHFNSYVVPKRLDMCVDDSREARLTSFYDSNNPPYYLVYVYDDRYEFGWLSGTSEIEECEGSFKRDERAIAYYALSYLLEGLGSKLCLETLQTALTQAEWWFMKTAIRAEA